MSKRGRSLVTIFAPTALRKIGQLQFHLDQSDIDYLEEPYNAHELVGPHARPGDKPLAGTTTPPSR